MASSKLGAKAISCSDDFFASMDNLVKPGRGIFIEDKYTDRGKWMDGWESRRKRSEGHDWVILKLGAPGIIHGLDVDTNHFLGNHPPFCSLEATTLSENEDISTAQWSELVSKSPLNPGSQHFFEVDDDTTYTHVRLHIYPDGGVARLKVYGEVKRDWTDVKEDDLIDLAAAVNGGKSIGCNDMFFSHMDNLIMPGEGVNMGDGWETKRNRIPNNRDWVIIRLGHPGILEKVILDTKHFKGNYPDSFELEGCYSEDDNLENKDWFGLITRTKLGPDQEHVFMDQLLTRKILSHVRLFIYPDGGVSRLRLWGYLKKRNDSRGV